MTIHDTIEKPTGVFLQVMIPTTYWEPHRDWQHGLEPYEGISADDLVQQENGYWSKEAFFAYAPEILAAAVKRWREPQGTEHTDQAQHLVRYGEGGRVVYGFPREIGTIERPAHPLLGSWVVMPEKNPLHPVIVQTSDLEILRKDNVPPAWRQGPTHIEVESDEEEVTPMKSPAMHVDVPCAPDGDARLQNNSEKSSIDGLDATIVKENNLNAPG